MQKYQLLYFSFLQLWMLTTTVTKHEGIKLSYETWPCMLIVCFSINMAQFDDKFHVFLYIFV